MPRRPLTLLAILLLAVASTILSSWACAMWAPNPSTRRSDPPANEPLAWQVRAPSNWPHPTYRYRYRSRLLTIVQSQSDAELSTRVSGVSCHQISIACGWPAHALRFGASWTAYSGVPAREQYHAAVAAPFLRPRNNGRRLPLNPIPLGFAANTAFYIVVIYALTAGATLTRRAYRTHHNRCPRCAYDLSDNPTICPECGQPNPQAHLPSEPRA